MAGRLPLPASFQFPISFSRVACLILDCARRTRGAATARSVSTGNHRFACSIRSIPTLSEGNSQIVLYCAHRTSTFLSCAFCEQEGHLPALSSHLSLFTSPSLQGGLFGLLLRVSYEHLLSVRVPRAQETNRPPCPSLDCPFYRLL